MAKPGVTQSAQRRDVQALDQYGREWNYCVEIATGDITGGVQASNSGETGWVDPLRTPQKYIRQPKKNGQIQLGVLFVDIDHWIRDITEDYQRWFKQLVENAQILYKKMEPADIPKLKDDPYILQATGKPPWPPAEVLKLAKAGHKGFLGLEPLTVQDRAKLGELTYDERIQSTASLEEQVASPLIQEEVIPQTYPLFVSWALKFKKAENFTEAAKLWNDYQAGQQKAAEPLATTTLAPEPPKRKPGRPKKVLV